MSRNKHVSPANFFLQDQFLILLFFSKVVPESVAKIQKCLKARNAKLVAKKLALRKECRAARALAIKKAQKYEKEYAAVERSLIAKRRVARMAGNFFKEAEPKLAFVIRIKRYFLILSYFSGYFPFSPFFRSCFVHVLSIFFANN